MPSNPSAPHRIYTFDLLRGVAVLTMILAHSVYFFHSRDNRGLVQLENFGNTVSFVTFLLVSGAVSWLAYFGHRGQVVNRKRVFTRIMLFLVAYYLLAISVATADILKAVGYDRIQLVMNILTFRFMPGFTEFFPPFIFYSILIALFPKIFSRIGRSLRGTVLVSLLAFLLGYVLYQFHLEGFYKPWVALFVGAEGLYRFPVLQYLPVFLLGLYWGHETLQAPTLQHQRIFTWRLGLWFAALAGAAWVLSQLTGLSLPTIFSRWPPTVPFLALGLSFAFGVAFVLHLTGHLRRIVILRDLLLVFGQNAIGLFWSHIFLLGLYATAGGEHVSSVGLFFFLFGLLLIASLAMTTFLPFNFRLALTLVRGTPAEDERALEQSAVMRLSQDVASETAGALQWWRNYFWPVAATKPTLKKRHQLGITFIALATAALVIPAASQQIAINRQEQGSTAWWSDAYAFRQPVALENTENFVTLQPQTTVAVEFNHQALVAGGQSRADGQDVRLVYWTGDVHIIATSAIENPDSDHARLIFRLPAKLTGAQPNKFYYLYYGGFVAAPAALPKLETTTNIVATFGSFEPYPLVASVTKRWALIGEPSGETLAFNLTTQRPYDSAIVTYQVLDSTLSGEMVNSSATSWEAEIPVALLPAGAYRIQATLVDAQGKTHLSQVTGFFRSAPLYVAWTQDWEGYDVNQTYLDAMESIATQYVLPITHFFNPRIYVTETIASTRAKALTKWLQRRLTLGDGYALHLHLFYDFVEQAGVTVRKTPNWGDSGNGYGVPLGEYTKEEQTSLITYGNDLLFANGLPKATIFRAGGWYADLDTLAALEDLGFTVDSSARTAYRFGRNSLSGYWKISATTKPYYPSRRDQNVAGSDNPFSVLEIPDNGADSYAFSAEAMIERFTVNLKSGILDQPSQVTFLSHPHWFDDKEQARIRELFSYVSRYTLADDHGPVIFTTTQKIADVFARE